MEQIPLCVRCGSLVFWRDHSNAVRCSVCEPALAAWLIRERLRATTADNSQLRRCMRIVLREFNDAGSVNAKKMIEAAEREKISVATLTRARKMLRIRPPQ